MNRYSREDYAADTEARAEAAYESGATLRPAPEHDWARQEAYTALATRLGLPINHDDLMLVIAFGNAVTVEERAAERKRVESAYIPLVEAAEAARDAMIDVIADEYTAGGGRVVLAGQPMQAAVIAIESALVQVPGQQQADTGGLIQRLLKGLLYAHADVERLRQTYANTPLGDRLEAICDGIGAYFTWDGDRLIATVTAVEQADTEQGGV